MSYHSSLIYTTLDEYSGNIAGARNHLMQLAAEDHRFLWGLTRAMLPGILTYALEKAAKGDDPATPKGRPVTSPRTTGFDREAAQTDPVDLEELMDALAKTINSNEGQATVARSGKVSQKHIDAIHRIAKRKYRH